MNPDNGELRRLRRGEQLPDGFEELDGGLNTIARLKLERAARAQQTAEPVAHVNLKSRSPLADFAKKKRLAKIAAKSRRRNRK